MAKRKFGKKRQPNEAEKAAARLKHRVEMSKKGKDPDGDPMLRYFVSGAFRNADTAHRDKRRKPRNVMKREAIREQQA